MIHGPHKSENLTAFGRFTAKEVNAMTSAEIIAQMKPLLTELESRRPQAVDLGELLAGSAGACAESPEE
jgi:hypothetical protein